MFIDNWFLNITLRKDDRKKRKNINLFNRQFCWMPTRRSTVKHYMCCQSFRHLTTSNAIGSCITRQQPIETCSTTSVCVHMSRGEFTNVLWIRTSFKFKSILVGEFQCQEARIEWKKYVWFFALSHLESEFYLQFNSPRKFCMPLCIFQNTFFISFVHLFSFFSPNWNDGGFYKKNGMNMIIKKSLDESVGKIFHWKKAKRI